MSAPTPDAQADALEQALTPEDRALLDALANALAARRLVTPALFFLESMKPLGFVASQALQFFRPLVQIVRSEPGTYDRLAHLLEQRGAIELLVRRLEDRA